MTTNQNERLVCAMNETPGPVNGADIAELTDVIQDGLTQITHLLYRHLPLRRRLWWKLTEYLYNRFGS